MTRLLVLRHAESEWNAQGRWQGQADPPLSPRGREQALRAGPILRPLGFSEVISSGLARARTTAELIAPALGLAGPIGIETDLAEYDLGDWSGLTRSEIEAGWPGDMEEWRQGVLFVTPGGERRDDFVARITAAAARVARDRPGQTVLVLSHGGVISALCRAFGGPARRFGHLCGVWLDTTPQGLRAGDGVALLDADLATTDSGEGTALAPPGASEIMDTPAR